MSPIVEIVIVGVGALGFLIGYASGRPVHRAETLRLTPDIATAHLHMSTANITCRRCAIEGLDGSNKYRIASSGHVQIRCAQHDVVLAHIDPNSPALHAD